MNKTFNQKESSSKNFSNRFRENNPNHTIIKELINLADIGVAYVNSQFILEYANQSFVEDFVNKNQLQSPIGHSLVAIFGQELFDKNYAFYNSAMDGNRLVIEQKHQDGKLWKLSYVPNQIEGFYIYAEVSRKESNFQDEIKTPNEDKIAENELTHMRQILLQNELEHRNRELTTQSIFLKQKDNVLIEVQKSLESILSQAGGELRNKIRFLIQRIDNSIENEPDWQNFKLHFERIHPRFFDKLIGEYPKLTQSELRHCAYLKMTMSPKQVAKILNVSSKSVDMARYRLKKKLQLEAGLSLAQDVNTI